jgi:SAM-dependent methyltransferase
MEAASTAKESMPPQAVVMQMVLGAWMSRVISDVTQLNVPDVLKRHGAMSAAEMVARHRVDAKPDFLERALRACASVGIFTEDGAGRFGPTELSDVLTFDSAVSVKKVAEVFVGGWAWKCWGGFGDAIRTGEPQARNQLGLDMWDYLRANPKEMEEFGESMKSNSLNSLRGVLENCDFTDVKKVVDVGGGFGHLAVALLEKYPHLQAAVLDMPAVVPIAKAKFPVNDAGIASRLEYIGGDMFESVPPADVYVMKHIIHDWDDERCIRLLRNCNQSLQGDGRVICVDAILPPLGDTLGTAAKLLDLAMMVFIPGKERTRAQWEALYQAAGLRIQTFVPLQDNFGTSIIEGVRG